MESTFPPTVKQIEINIPKKNYNSKSPVLEGKWSFLLGIESWEPGEYEVTLKAYNESDNETSNVTIKIYIPVFNNEFLNKYKDKT